MPLPPEPQDPFVLPPKPPAPKGHIEDWRPHPSNKKLEYDAGFPGVNKPMRPREPEKQG